jgi:hypothetical protein
VLMVVAGDGKGVGDRGVVELEAHERELALQVSASSVAITEAQSPSFAGARSTVKRFSSTLRSAAKLHPGRASSAASDRSTAYPRGISRCGNRQAPTPRKLPVFRFSGPDRTASP